MAAAAVTGATRPGRPGACKTCRLRRWAAARSIPPGAEAKSSKNAPGATCANPSYGLFVGIVLCIFMEIVGMNKKERRANIEEGIEIYMKNTRAELDDLDAKAAAKAAKKA